MVWNNRKIYFFSDLLGFLREFIYMFLSSHENKVDKKGRVSVPATFRSYITNLGYNGFICYPSFNYSAIEACSQNRIEQIADSIDALNPFEEKRDVFATSVLAESSNVLVLTSYGFSFGLIFQLLRLPENTPHAFKFDKNWVLTHRLKTHMIP